MSRKLLLVDDEEAFRNALAEVLEASGLGEIVCAGDGVEALEILSQQDMDLLITDINMPRLTGVGLVKELRERGYTLPVIVVTGVRHGVDQLSELDVQATLLKPFKFTDLLGHIDRIFNPPVEPEA